MGIATAKRALTGGEFLVTDARAEDTFIPENWDEEQRMIGQTCQEFIEQKVVPVLDRLDKQEGGLMGALLEEAGELGMLGVSIPEEYGGVGKDFTTSMLVCEKTGAGASFSASFMAHTSIGTLPILYYGNEAQKNKYLPKLATGEWRGSYCLTEPSAGSDANAGKTRATRSADGAHYVLNGQKMWITNAGIADVFTVFAKIDDDATLSAFIVEKGYPGLSLHTEEQKLGIRGSSTRQLFFTDCQVPMENLLSERGNGFKIAVNILNLGRIKMGGAVLGGAKKVISNTVQYANERAQFGRAIATYGAIQHKIGEQALRTYATESAIYRASQNIEDAINSLVAGGLDPLVAKLKGMEQFAIEAAIIKVHASEVLDYVVDEGVQVYGGMGYSADAPMERAYRDSRINRIVEGTNEINRMLTVDMLLKRAMKGELDLMGPAQAVANELLSIAAGGPENDPAPFAQEKQYVKNFKKAVLLVVGAAVQKLVAKLSDEQEVLMYLADMLIETYVSESVQLRVEKLVGQRGAGAVPEQVAMMQVYLHDAADRICKAGKEALNTFAKGDERRLLLVALKRYTKTGDLNTTRARRRIAEKLIKDNQYSY